MIESLTSSPVLLLVVLGVLLFAAHALLGGISAVVGLIAELLGALFASVRALALISLLIVLVVAMMLGGGGDAVTVGMAPPVAG